MYMTDDINSLIKPVTSVIGKTVSTTTTVNGVAVDTSIYRSFTYTGARGAASGSPTTSSVVYTLQESDTEGGTYTDVAAADAISLTSDNTEGREGFQCADLTKRWVRLKAVATLAGGTSPTVAIGGGMLIMGGARVVPTA